MIETLRISPINFFNMRPFLLNNLLKQKLKSYIFVFVFLLGILLSPNISNAKSRGADLFITYIGNNTYRATLSVLIRCDNYIAPSWISSSYQPKLYMRAGKNADSSAGSAVFSMTNQGWSIATHSCTTNPTYGCSSVSYVHMKEYKYTVDINMNSALMKKILSSSKCEDLLFIVHDYNMWRQESVGKCNLTELVLTATLKVKNINSCKSKTNIAPVNLLPRTCEVSLFQTNAVATGYTDTNEFDQLSFELANVLTTEPPSTSYCYGIPTGITTVPLTPYCPVTPNTPYTCSPSPKLNPARGFFFDTLTGDMVFTPIVADEVSRFRILVKEYRKDSTGKYVLIAINTRETVFVVIDDKNANQPGFNSSYPNLNLCVDEYTCNTLFNITDNPTPTQTSVDSLIVVVPFQLPWMKNNPVTYVKNNSAYWKVCYKPTLKDTTKGTVLIPILIHDNHCDHVKYHSRTLAVKVNNKPFANREIKYLGCNKLMVKSYNANSDELKINWQITNNFNSNIVLAQGNSDTVKLYGNGKYYVRTLMSNGTNCFSSFLDSFTVSDTPADIILSNSEGPSKGSDSFACKVNDYAIKPLKTIGKSPIKYQWYGTNINALDPKLNNAWQVDPSGFAKISNDSHILVKAYSDTLVYVQITDANGCKASAYQRVGFANASAIQWKSKPLTPVCYNSKELLLLSPTNKYLGAATVNGKINTINGKNIDSLGPDKYNILLPKFSNKDKEIITLIAYYDTLTCHSTDTTTLVVLFQPKFELRSDTFTQCTDFPELALSNLVSTQPKNVKTMVWTPLNWPKNSAKPTLYNAGNAINQDYRIFNNKDSLPIGSYQFRACATDTINGCLWCDTAIAIATPVRFTQGIDKTLCPNDALLPIFNLLTHNGKTVDSSTFKYQLTSFNYDTTVADFPKNYLLSNMRFNPRSGIGLFHFVATPNELCWRGKSFDINVLDTPYAHIITDPKDSSILPNATIFFDANTNGTRLRWDFGTGSAGDTATVKSLNWAYDKKLATYHVKFRAWGDNGCWGEDQINYKITDVNSVSHWKLGDEISGNLILLNPNYQFIELRLMDLNGKTVAKSRENQGVSIFKSHGLSTGTYLFRMEIKANNQRKSEFYQGKIFLE